MNRTTIAASLVLAVAAPRGGAQAQIAGSTSSGIVETIRLAFGWSVKQTLPGKAVKAAESRLAELKRATVSRWKEFEAGVGEATSQLRKSTTDTAG